MEPTEEMSDESEESLDYTGTLEELQKRSIAEIYSQYPDESCESACQVLDQQQLHDVIIFENVVELYLYGIMHYKKLRDILDTKEGKVEYIKKILDDDFDITNINQFTKEILELPTKWIFSSGFSVQIKEIQSNTYYDILKDIHPTIKKNNFLYNNYYCSIDFKCGPASHYFEYEKVDNFYLIQLNSHFKPHKIHKLSDLYMLIEFNNKVYFISFSYN